jgi:hypothetical protein
VAVGKNWPGNDNLTRVLSFIPLSTAAAAVYSFDSQITFPGTGKDERESAASDTFCITRNAKYLMKF